MAVIGYSVSLRGYEFNDATFTFNLASGITAEHVGRGVTLDNSGDTKVKLAGDGDYILGRLETYEDRTQEGIKVGTVAIRFSDLLPIAEGETVSRGDTVVGAGDGFVKAKGTGSPFVAAPDHTINFVSAISGDYAVVTKI